MTFEEDKSTEFELYFLEIKTAIRGQPGCHDVKLLRDKKRKEIFFTYSVWENESFLNAYRKSSLFATVWPKVKNWFALEPEAWSTELIA